MASKKELVEAQTFSRRRLLTAFVSGAPGGRELEPTKPLRAVVAGVGLSVLLVLGSLGFGLLSPTLKQGWDHNSLVVTRGAEDGGTRYVALGGTLHPVLNLASARLLVPSGSFKVVLVGEDRIADAPRGDAVGIPGAPDALPDPERLRGTGWTSCLSAAGGLATRVGDPAGLPDELAAAADPERADPGLGLVVRTETGDLHLVAGGRHHLIPAAASSGVLRGLQQESVVAWDVPAAWLNLFEAGSDLEPLEVPGEGTPLDASAGAPPDAVVGSVLTVTDSGQRYVVLEGGELARLSELAAPLYELGSGARASEHEVSLAQISGMRNAETPLAPADWPASLPVPVAADDAACAVLVSGTDAAPRVVLAAGDDVELGEGVTAPTVEPGSGALVSAWAGGTGGLLHLLDETGTVYALPGADEEVLGRLGYTPDHVSAVPQHWLALFPSGPELTTAAAVGDATVAEG